MSLHKVLKLDTSLIVIINKDTIKLDVFYVNPCGLKIEERSYA